MFSVPCTLLLTLAVAQHPEPSGPLAEAARPKLLVKEQDYLLHALPLGSAEQSFKGERGLAFWQPLTTYTLALLHTSTATGEMKILAFGGTTVDETLARFRNCSRPDISHFRIAGVAADRERIYVLRWQSTPNKEPSLHLFVFRPATGEQVHSLEIKGDAVPRAEPRETADKGALHLHADGVSCFDTRFVFRGTRLIKQSPLNRP